MRQGWFRPDKHYIEHDSHKARITRGGLKSPAGYTVHIKSRRDWRRPYRGPFKTLDEALDAAELQLEIHNG